jgi:hypothetical protein
VAALAARLKDAVDLDSVRDDLAVAWPERGITNPASPRSARREPLLARQGEG